MLVASLQTKVLIFFLKNQPQEIIPCFDFFEGSSSVAEPARFRVPVGAAPFQAMIIHSSEVGERCILHDRNYSRAS